MPASPIEKIKLFGPGTDSGTFDYFTEVINGKAKASRSDYAASEDDNVLVQGVSGEKGGLGYFGYSYYEENQDKLRAVQVTNPKTGQLRRSVGRDRPERHLQAARPAALHLREGLVVQAARGAGVPQVHLRQRGRDREAGGVRLAHAGPAEEGADQLRSRRQGGQQVEESCEQLERRGRPERAALSSSGGPAPASTLDIFRFINMKGSTMRGFTAKVTGVAQ